jgi:hypothetical protein
MLPLPAELVPVLESEIKKVLRGVSLPSGPAELELDLVEGSVESLRIELRRSPAPEAAASIEALLGLIRRDRRDHLLFGSLRFRIDAEGRILLVALEDKLKIGERGRRSSKTD